MIEWNAFDGMRKYEVEAASVEDFLERYYRAARYHGRGEEYAASLLGSYQKMIPEFGCCWISHHDSRTGESVSWYPS